MKDWKERYLKSLKNTPGPVELSQYKNIKLDLRGLIAYARVKGISPGDLSEKEKSRFIHK